MNSTQRGYILLPVVLAITLIAAIAFLLNREGTAGSHMASGDLQSERVRYVAQAGLEHAEWKTQASGCGPYTDITAQAFGNDTYSTTLTTDLGVTSSYNIAVDQDTWLRSDQAATNYASDVNMHLRFEPGIIGRPLLRYDLSSIPANAAVLSATAWFYLNAEHPEGPADIHSVTADWTETDATWSTMGDKMDSAILASIPAQTVADVWVSVNLTAQVQAWVNGQPNYGIALNSISEDSDGKYSSRESSEQPYLEVIVGAPPSSPAILKSVGTLSNGASRSITRDNLILEQGPPGFVQLQLNGTDGKDAILDGFYNNRNHGDYVLKVSSDPSWLINSLLYFKHNTVPSGARIISARLELYHSITQTADADAGVDVHRVTRDWVEGTKSGTGIADGATWDTYDGSNAWTTAGGDYDPSAIAGTPVTATTGDWQSWEIKSLVQGWLDGTYANDGLLLKGTGSVNVSFASKEDSNLALHPKLTITYACTCGTACLVPQGSGRILMAVVNPTSPVPADANKKAIFESWGYTVNMISESANQSTYDSEALNNDVIYISNTVNSNQLGGKLASQMIGVVSEDGDYNADLGFSTGAGWTAGSAVDITDTSHYITLPFTSGALSIFSKGMERLTVSGTEALGLQTLAAISGAGALAVLDQGVSITGGGTAAGRRALLPLGRSVTSDFNWDYLNNNGRLMVQRAIQWAGTTPPVGLAGTVLLVVGNAASPAAKDIGRIELMEDWDYTVTLIDDGDTQANFNLAIDAADVVYVSGTSVGGTLLEKLTGADIGLVNELDGKLDNFGFSSSSTSTVTADSFSSTDAAHYISESFDGNPVTVFTTSMSMPVPGGTLAPALSNVGEVTGTAALVTLFTGATRYDSNPAPARRVHLPFAAADKTQLTDDGKLLMQRSIEWAAGAGCVVLQPLLMVVADAGNPSTEESTRRALIESWCYNVTLIDDSDTQDNFNTAMAVNEVAYVSRTISATELGSKLRAATIGVVIEKRTPDFGLANSFQSKSRDEIDIVDNTHYITSPYSTGVLTYLSSLQPVTLIDSGEAPDLHTLGTAFNTGSQWKSALVVINPGGALAGSGTATGRRVQLPWGAAGFDINALNAAGRDIMKRSIEWAQGADGTGLKAHWKMDDGTGLIAIDSVGGHDGALTGSGGPAWVTGQVGDALDFDGVDDYLDVGSFDVIGTGLTLMGWFKAETIPTSDGRIISKADGPGEPNAWWQLSTTDSGSNRYMRMRIKAGGTTTTLADSSENLLPGQWYFAVATYDSLSATMKLYLDGVEIATGSHGVGGLLDSGPGVPVAVGANGTAERFFDGLLDDVRVYGRALSATEISDLYIANGPCNGTYRDNFDAQNFSGTNGSLSWSANPWSEVGESDGASSGDVIVLNDLSNYQLRIRDNNNGGEGVERIADLSGASSATLTFDYRRVGLDNSNDYVAVSVSSTGIAGPWTELDQIGTSNDASYQAYSRDISGHISADTAIRLRSSSSMGNTDTVWFDNIQIQCN